MYINTNSSVVLQLFLILKLCKHFMYLLYLHLKNLVLANCKNECNVFTITKKTNATYKFFIELFISPIISPLFTQMNDTVSDVEYSSEIHATVARFNLIMRNWKLLSKIGLVKAMGRSSVYPITAHIFVRPKVY